MVFNIIERFFLFFNFFIFVCFRSHLAAWRRDTSAFAAPPAAEPWHIY